jgi:hypothetical protein
MMTEIVGVNIEEYGTKENLEMVTLLAKAFLHAEGDKKLVFAKAMLHLMS